MKKTHILLFVSILSSVICAHAKEPRETGLIVPSASEITASSCTVLMLRFVIDAEGMTTPLANTSIKAELALLVNPIPSPAGLWTRIMGAIPGRCAQSAIPT